MIHPHITYGILAWGNASSSILNKLFKRANILTLPDQIEYEKLLFMYDYDAGNIPFSFNNLYTYNHENSDFASKLPIYNFPHIWNSWSGKFNKITSRSSLKRQIKDRLLAVYASHVKCSNPQCTERV